jgi:hypothetical protein
MPYRLKKERKMPPNVVGTEKKELKFLRPQVNTLNFLFLKSGTDVSSKFSTQKLNVKFLCLKAFTSPRTIKPTH